VNRIFLLSPANASGVRASIVLNPTAEFDLAIRLREPGAPLGEIFAFISGLYFRGKLSYSKRFAHPPPGIYGSMVITSRRGLLAPETVICPGDLRHFAAVPIDPEDRRYRDPVQRAARVLAQAITSDCEVVLLGSVASPKYTEPLAAIFGSRLMFPSAFVGRGDMSRGGLMLRCVRAGTELEYIPISGLSLRGSRPPKLSRFDSE
jgi:hypothetical protein